MPKGNPAFLCDRGVLSEDRSFALARWGQDSCPDESTPSIGELSDMQAPEAAEMAENNVREAQVNDSPSSERTSSTSSTTGDREQANQKESAASEADVGVSW